MLISYFVETEIQDLQSCTLSEFDTGDGFHAVVRQIKMSQVYKQLKI